MSSTRDSVPVVPTDLRLSSAAASALELRDVFKIYREGAIETVALRGAWLTVRPGEFLAIVGPSGSGKSTLLGIAAGLAAPSAGQVMVEDQNLTTLDEAQRADLRRQRLGIVFQRDNLLPFLSAIENVEVALRMRGTPQNGRAAALLERVGLANRLHHRPHQLSGGEQQRVAIAAALVNDPAVLLADEPTGELDSTTAAGIIDLLLEINRERRMTIVLVTHNLALAARADRACMMLDGLLTEFDPATAEAGVEVVRFASAALPTTADAPVVEATAVTKTFAGGVQALRGVSLAVHPGETLTIMGPSGCGKSTLLNLLGGLDRPTTGTVTLNGRDLGRTSPRDLAHLRRRDLGFVFQAHNLLATLTAAENVTLPLILSGAPEQQRRQRAAELLEQVGLSAHADKLPDQLSGGQRQRVAIARGLANAPKLLLADEPTGNLDSEAAAAVAELLARICREQQVALVLVTHDRRVAAKSDRILEMRDGQVVAAGTTNAAAGARQ